jgi:hypothetical protein
MSCDACILQLTWETEEGIQSFCSDVDVSGGEVLECAGGCEN